MSEHVQIPEKQNVFVYLDGGYLKKGFINELSGKISNGASNSVYLIKIGPLDYSQWYPSDPKGSSCTGKIYSSYFYKEELGKATYTGL